VSPKIISMCVDMLEDNINWVRLFCDDLKTA
jgi:hypothetical protein